MFGKVLYEMKVSSNLPDIDLTCQVKVSLVKNILCFKTLTRQPESDIHVKEICTKHFLNERGRDLQGYKRKSYI